MALHFNYPPPCNRCGKIHAHCTSCGWRHDLDAVMNFHCIQCGTGHIRKAPPDNAQQPPSQSGDLSDRQKLERLMAAPAAVRPAPSPSLPPSADRADLTRFLWEQYPSGAGPVRTEDVYPAWVTWCRAHDLYPRTLTWLCSNLGRCRCTHRLASGRRWRIHPAPPPQDRPWLEAIARVRLKRPAAADLVEQHSHLVAVQDGTAYIRAHRLRLPALQRHNEVIQAALGKTLGTASIRWEAAEV